MSDIDELARVSCEEVFTSPGIALDEAPPTYPARPLNGGEYNARLPIIGERWYEPKINDWRALVHAPTGRMFNRKLEPFSIADQFRPALGILNSLWEATDAFECDWFDVLALERRHTMGRGTLIMLDYLNPLPPYLQRQAVMHRWVIPMNPLGSNVPCGENELRCIEPTRFGQELWDRLKIENLRLGCEFYEGMVAKRADSKYPFQKSNPEKPYPHWVKHRWAF